LKSLKRLKYIKVEDVSGLVSS